MRGGTSVESDCGSWVCAHNDRCSCKHRAVTKTTTAVLLVAGVGSRLRPLTDDRPKALVPIAGKTIVDRAVETLCAFGVTRIVLATGYREDAIREAARNWDAEVSFCPNPRFRLNSELRVAPLLSRSGAGGARSSSWMGTSSFTRGY